MSQLTEAAQAASLSARVDLYTLDLTIFGGTVQRFTPGPADGAAVVFDGQTYPPIPIKATGFEWNGRGKQPRPRLRISNVTNFASLLNIQFNDLVGATVTRLRTLKRFLDGQPDADPTAHWPIDVFRVDMKTAQNKTFAEWQLASAIDQQGRKLPGRQITRFCPLRYRVWNSTSGTFDYSAATCPYVGSQSFDRNGNAVASGADDVPSKLLGTCCEARFGVGTVLPFGGFPGVGLGRT